MSKSIENEMALENEEVITENQETTVETEVDQNFEPMLIGETDQRAQNISDAAYFAVCEVLTNLKEALEKLLLEGRFSIDVFLECIKSKDPEKWIFQKYITAKNINFPGMDPDRLFELKLTKVEGIEFFLELHNQFLSALTAVKNSGFYFPLKKLFNAEENIFAITTEFCQQQERRFSRFTQTHEQNVILQKFTELCEILNALNSLNVVRAKNGHEELKVLADYLEINISSNKGPFVVDSTLFYKHRLSGYRIKDFAFRNAPKFEELFS